MHREAQIQELERSLHYNYKAEPNIINNSYNKLANSSKFSIKNTNNYDNINKDKRCYQNNNNNNIQNSYIRIREKNMKGNSSSASHFKSTYNHHRDYLNNNNKTPTSEFTNNINTLEQSISNLSTLKSQINNLQLCLDNENKTVGRYQSQPKIDNYNKNSYLNDHIKSSNNKLKSKVKFDYINNNHSYNTNNIFIEDQKNESNQLGVSSYNNLNHATLDYKKDSSVLNEVNDIISRYKNKSNKTLNLDYDIKAINIDYNDNNKHLFENSLIEKYYTNTINSKNSNENNIAVSNTNENLGNLININSSSEETNNNLIKVEEDYQDQSKMLKYYKSKSENNDNVLSNSNDPDHNNIHDISKISNKNNNDFIDNCNPLKNSANEINSKYNNDIHKPINYEYFHFEVNLQQQEKDLKKTFELLEKSSISNHQNSEIRYNKSIKDRKPSLQNNSKIIINDINSIEIKNQILSHKKNNSHISNNSILKDSKMSVKNSNSNLSNLQNSQNSSIKCYSINNKSITMNYKNDISRKSSVSKTSNLTNRTHKTNKTNNLKSSVKKDNSFINKSMKSIKNDKSYVSYKLLPENLSNKINKSILNNKLRHTIEVDSVSKAHISNDSYSQNNIDNINNRLPDLTDNSRNNIVNSHDNLEQLVHNYAPTNKSNTSYLNNNKNILTSNSNYINNSKSNSSIQNQKVSFNSNNAYANSNSSNTNISNLLKQREIKLNSSNLISNNNKRSNNDYNKELNTNNSKLSLSNTLSNQILPSNCKMNTHSEVNKNVNNNFNDRNDFSNILNNNKTNKNNNIAFMLPKPLSKQQELIDEIQREEENFKTLLSIFTNNKNEYDDVEKNYIDLKNHYYELRNKVFESENSRNSNSEQIKILHIILEKDVLSSYRNIGLTNPVIEKDKHNNIGYSSSKNIIRKISKNTNKTLATKNSKSNLSYNSQSLGKNNLTKTNKTNKTSSVGRLSSNNNLNNSKNKSSSQIIDNKSTFSKYSKNTNNNIKKTDKPKSLAKVNISAKKKKEDLVKKKGNSMSSNSISNSNPGVFTFKNTKSNIFSNK